MTIQTNFDSARPMTSGAQRGGQTTWMPGAKAGTESVTNTTSSAPLAASGAACERNQLGLWKMPTARMRLTGLPRRRDDGRLDRHELRQAETY